MYSGTLFESFFVMAKQGVSCPKTPKKGGKKLRYQKSPVQNVVIEPQVIEPVNEISNNSNAITTTTTTSSSSSSSLPSTTTITAEETISTYKSTTKLRRVIR
jgi:hypothetical protein